MVPASDHQRDTVYGGSGSRSDTISGIMPSEDYSFRMRVDYTDGTVSDYVDGGSYGMTLTNAVSLSATADAELPGWIDLSWSPPSGGGTVNYYVLQYHSTSTGGPVWLPWDLSSNGIEDNNGTLSTSIWGGYGATDWYRMAALYDGGGSSDWGSASATANPVGSVGSTSIQATANSDGSIDLSWTLPPDNHTDEPYYEWDYSLAVGSVTAPDGSGTKTDVSSDVFHDGDTGVCTAHLTGLIGGTHYYFADTSGKLFAGVSWSGDIIYGSGDATTTGTNATVPVAPMAAYAAEDRLDARFVDVYWRNSTKNEDHFILERSVNGGAFAQVGGNISADQTSYRDTVPKEQFTDPSVAPTLTYRVRAVNAAGTSVPSPTATVHLSRGGPDVTADLLAMATDLNSQWNRLWFWQKDTLGWGSIFPRN